MTTLQLNPSRRYDSSPFTPDDDDPFSTNYRKPLGGTQFADNLDQSDGARVPPSADTTPTRVTDSMEGAGKLLDEPPQIAPPPMTSLGAPPQIAPPLPDDPGAQARAEEAATEKSGTPGPVKPPIMQNSPSDIPGMVAKYMAREAPKKPTNNLLQTIGKTALGFTKFAPAADAIIHPKYTEELGNYRREGLDLADKIQLKEKQEDLASRTETRKLSTAVRLEQAYTAALSHGVTFYPRGAAVPDGLIPTATPPELIDSQAGMQAYFDQNHGKFHVSKEQSELSNKALAAGEWAPLTVYPELVKAGVALGKPIKDTVEVSAAQAKDMGVLNPPNKDGTVSVPTTLAIKHMELLKAKPEPAAAAKQSFSKIMQKIAADLGPGAATNDAVVERGIRTSSKLTDAEKNEALAYRVANPTPAATATAGVIRMEVAGQNKENIVFDTKNGNSPVLLSSPDVNAANRLEPGRYVPAGPAAPALQKTALIEDIRGNIQKVRGSLKSIPEFSNQDKVKIATAMKSRDPSSAISALLTSGVAGSMTPQQQEYLINHAQLLENAYAMRSVLGAGQGSDDLRSAIASTIPGPTTPNKAYAAKQLDAFEQVLNRLERGVPKVSLRTDTGASGGAAPPAAAPSKQPDQGDGKPFHVTDPNGVIHGFDTRKAMDIFNDGLKALKQNKK